MKNQINLIVGEIKRLIKYKILPIGIVVSFIWVFIIWVSEPEFALNIIPLLITVDATMMSIILFASSHFLEKQEGSIKSVMVAPVTITEIIIAKIFAAIITTLVSAVVVVGAAMLIHKIAVSIVLLLVYCIVVVAAHIAIGFIIVLFSKDFGAMLGLYALYAFSLMIPTVLLVTGIIPESASAYMLISPTHASQILFNSVFGEEQLWMVLISLGYLIAISIVLYRFVVYKSFKKALIGG